MSTEDLDTQADAWLGAVGARGSTVPKHRRALMDFATWLAGRGLTPFGDHIEDSILGWEDDMATRLKEDTVRRRVTAVESFYEWHRCQARTLELGPLETCPAAVRSASLRAAMTEFNARRADTDRIRMRD